jgi:uncharacterized metal-binding protein YceD (DUF177 family)
MITSRLTTCKYKRKTHILSICLTCRPNFVFWLTNEFKQVIIESETCGQQTLKVIQ